MLDNMLALHQHLETSHKDKLVLVTTWGCRFAALVEFLASSTGARALTFPVCASCKAKELA